ncbi:putative Integral membrane protein [Seiridium cardinale]|uniref:Integral membrane protein n=1 Tax=Seiridium cardinale TaxID=138064 RepID=A0ABR2XEP0_9PEZI
MSSALDGLYLLTPEQQDAIINGPALAPPPGTEANFNNPPNENQLVQAVLIICITLVTLLILLRAYAKVVCVGKVQIEDFLVLLGYGVYIGYAYCLFRFVEIGFFVHQWDLRVSTLNEIIYFVQLAVNFYAIAIIFLKSSILLEWTRIFVPRGTRGSFFHCADTIALVDLSLSVVVHGLILLLGGGRRKSELIWDKRIPGTCYDRTPLDLSTASVNLLADVVILLFPQRVIWRLQLGLKKKIGVSVIFTIGLLACVSAAFRLAATVEYSKSPDWSYSIAKVGLWYLAELTCLFIVFCIPGIPKAFADFSIPSKIASLLSSHIPSFGSQSKNTGTSGSSSGNSKTTNSSNMYRRMEDDEIPLENLANAGTITSPEQWPHDTPALPGMASSRDHILRTIEFTATEGSQNNGTMARNPAYHSSWDRVNV